MSNFQIAQQQTRVRRAARDLAQRILRCSLDELDAIEEQEAEVRYRFRCIRKGMRCSRSRYCSRHGMHIYKISEEKGSVFAPATEAEASVSEDSVP